MSEIRIEGADSIPEQPILVFPNRLDLPAMQELEKALGGSGRVAWMLENSLMPGEAILNKLKESPTKGFAYSTSHSPSSIFGKVNKLMESGRHVVVLAGRPQQAPGNLSDIPSNLLTLFDGFPQPVLPVYVGMYNNYLDAAITTREPYDRLHITICAPQREGPQLGSRVQAAWMSAQAEQFQQHPMLANARLPQLLVEALFRNPKGKVLDGTNDTSFNYNDLLSAAVLTSGILERKSSNARMGIILPPGKLSIIANLACLLSGISAVNINYTTTAAQFKEIVKQTALTRFITDSDFVNMQREFKWPLSRDLIFLDKELNDKGPWRLRLWTYLTRIRQPQQLIKDAKIVIPDADAEAAVFFTGGTEDKPLGVPFSHRMLLAAAMSIRSRLQLRPGHDTILSVQPAYTPAGFIFGILLPLLCDFNIVTYTIPTAGKRLCTLLQQHSVALVTNSPTGIRSMLKAAKTPQTFSQLQYCLSCGSKLPQNTAIFAKQHFGLKIQECYGMAEVLPFASASMPAPATNPDSTQPVLPTARQDCVGAPLPGIAVRITGLHSPDPTSTPANPGLIWLKGPAVTHQYLGISNADSPRMHGKWFCTGDIGHMNPDGMLTILGRRERFSQVNNQMIPHVQLEELIYKIYGVTHEDNKRKIAIIGVPSRTGGEALVLLTTLHQQITADDYKVLKGEINNHHYPDSWKPQHIIPVSHIPTLPNGKLDHKTCFRGACKALRINLE